LLHADDLAVSAFTINGLQKVSDKVESYCDKWGPKTNGEEDKDLKKKEGG
jgi:hypothetical protein